MEPGGDHEADRGTIRTAETDRIQASFCRSASANYLPHHELRMRRKSAARSKAGEQAEAWNRSAGSPVSGAACSNQRPGTYLVQVDPVDDGKSELTEKVALSLETHLGAGPADAFDFASHREKAIEQYQEIRPRYAQFAQAVRSILDTCISAQGITVHSIQHRAKEIDSFARKATKTSDQNPHQPRYRSPLSEITDLAGVRVIAYFLSSVDRVEPIIDREFKIVEKTDKSELLRREERLGYHSVHYIVELRPNRFQLPEYERFRGLRAEIQVRTILQHAWAEIEHDVQYKAPATLPAEIRRRFMTLAGSLEIADREFQAIQDEDARLRAEARKSVAAGNLDEVEITPDALKTYLDRKLGSDGRMADYSYQFTASLLRRLGFKDLEEVDRAISGMDDDRISRAIHGSRQGQLTRFEDMLLAAMGEKFITQHPWYAQENDWFVNFATSRLQKLREAGLAAESA